LQRGDEFVESELPFESKISNGAVAADLDLDGDMDIITSDVDVDIPPCNSSRELKVLENVNGTITYTYTGSTPWEINSYDTGILDINNDGLMDFFTGGCGSCWRWRP